MRRGPVQPETREKAAGTFVRNQKQAKSPRFSLHSLYVVTVHSNWIQLLSL